jgi:glycosyltransferase involved in cell wall biosynthesis
VEIGIGYSGSYLNYRIFESYGWLSITLAKENKLPNNYWFVIPHAFNSQEFVLSLKPTPKRIGYLGRIIDLKGCRIIMEIARKFPDVEFILCGQGDPKVYLEVPNIKYKEPIHGSQRSDYLGDCIAFLHPVKYFEPFGCGPVEAQLCGTPVICTDWGGMVETVEQFKTGLRCHTLADYCYGVQMALDSKFDRQYIRDRAVRLYDMYNLAKQYDYTLRSILDIHTPGTNGWYSPDAHIKRICEQQSEDTHVPVV